MNVIKSLSISYHTPRLLKRVTEELRRLLKKGIIIKVEKPDENCWVNPTAISEKKDETIRLVLDARKLNAATRKAKYPLPNIETLVSNIGTSVSDLKTTKGLVEFSTFDIDDAFGQLKINENSQNLCCFEIPYGELAGIYKFVKGFYGLTNTPLIFQHMMDDILCGMKDTFWFIDDILVVSAGEDDKERKLRKLFKRLTEYGLTLKPSKCAVDKDTIDWLGITFSREGTTPPIRNTTRKFKNQRTSKN